MMHTKRLSVLHTRLHCCDDEDDGRAAAVALMARTEISVQHTLLHCCDDDDDGRGGADG